MEEDRELKKLKNILLLRPLQNKITLTLVDGCVASNQLEPFITHKRQLHHNNVTVKSKSQMIQLVVSYDKKYYINISAV